LKVLFLKQIFAETKGYSKKKIDEIEKRD